MKIKYKLLALSVILTCLMLISCKPHIATPFNLTTSVPSPTSSPFISSIVDSIGQVEFRRILNGDKSNVRNYDVRVAENEVDFQQLWDDHTGSKTNPVFLPKVDFELKDVIG